MFNFLCGISENGQGLYLLWSLDILAWQVLQYFTHKAPLQIPQVSQELSRLFVNVLQKLLCFPSQRIPYKKGLTVLSDSFSDAALGPVRTLFSYFSPHEFEFLLASPGPIMDLEKSTSPSLSVGMRMLSLLRALERGSDNLPLLYRTLLESFPEQFDTDATTLHFYLQVLRFFGSICASACRTAPGCVKFAEAQILPALLGILRRANSLTSRMLIELSQVVLFVVTQSAPMTQLLVQQFETFGGEEEGGYKLIDNALR